MAISIQIGEGKFLYADANPLRFFEVKDFDPRYQSRPFDDYILDKYCQKWSRYDKTKLQFLSDFAFTFKIYDTNTGLIALTLTPLDKQITLTGETFKVYEIEIDFNALQEGNYFCEIMFADRIIQSEPFCVKDIQPKTLLFEYKNSYQDFGIVWHEGFNPSFRVEGGINLFNPGFDDVNFIDQEYNVTLLDSVPFRTFTLNIGNASGIPDWILDKVNRILSCDIVSIDSEYYQKNDGAKWSLKRPDPTLENEKTFVGASIEILPIDNQDEIGYEIDETDPTDQVIVVSKRLEYLNSGSNITIANVFSDGMVLNGIWIKNVAVSPFTIKIGTTNGGNEIGQWDITTERRWIQIDWPFDAVTTVYITGIDAVTLDIRVHYLDLAAKPLSPAQSAYSGLGVGAKMEYKEINAGDFIRDFNTATGFGNADTDWVDWKIDFDDSGLFKVGYNGSTYDIGTTGGSNSITLSKDQLPAVGVGLFASYVNLAGGDVPGPDDLVARARNFSNQSLNYEASKAPSSTTTFVGKSANLGVGAAIDNRPAFKVSVYVVRFQKTS